MAQDDDIISSPSPKDDSSIGENFTTSSQAGGTSDDDIIRLQEEIRILKEQLARAQADYNNYVRRSKDEIAQVSDWSENALLVKILPILDNLERALTHLPEEFKGHTWTEGLGATIKLLQKTLGEL